VAMIGGRLIVWNSGKTASRVEDDSVALPYGSTGGHWQWETLDAVGVAAPGAGRSRNLSEIIICATRARRASLGEPMPTCLQ